MSMLLCTWNDRNWIRGVLVALWRAQGFRWCVWASRSCPTGVFGVMWVNAVRDTKNIHMVGNGLSARTTNWYSTIVSSLLVFFPFQFYIRSNKSISEQFEKLLLVLLAFLFCFSHSPGCFVYLWIILLCVQIYKMPIYEPQLSRIEILLLNLLLKSKSFQTHSLFGH